MRLQFCLVALAMILMTACTPENTEYETLDDYPVYDGDDLGVTYSADKTSFRLWSPIATNVTVSIYAEGDGGSPLETHAMKRAEKGTWTLSLKGDQKGKFYTFKVQEGDKTLPESPGPYAKAVGVNGKRGGIIDLAETDPAGWSSDSRPALDDFGDVIIYELQVRDMSIHPSSGGKAQGKFLGLAETGTRSPEGLKTGIDHLVELGVTHVHILPMFDFRTIDESRLDEPQYNWGYDPQNYNAPEGSFSTDPFDPAVRIRELKTMIKALHDNGIRVIMDVVYNHTSFDQDGIGFMDHTVSDYYYRFNDEGQLSNASACGNETASERPMMRKYIVESVEYLASEYHLDGFRFDLMAIHDIETMNAVREKLNEIDPSILVYGEGWKAGGSPLPDEQLALKVNVPKLNGIAAFSDEIRDGLKGPWHDWEAPGFVSGNADRAEGVKFGIVGGTEHPQIDYGKVAESDIAWAPHAQQCLAYVSCHDNHTLYDKLKVVNPDASEEEILKMHVLANTVVLTSQAIPFLHAGVDFARTKQGVENSFDSPDSINQIVWSRKAEYSQLFDTYKSLIQFRKAHPALKLKEQGEISKRIQFLDDTPEGVLGYTLDAQGTGDSASAFAMYFNGSDRDVDITLPSGTWKQAIAGYEVNNENASVINGTRVKVPARTAFVAISE